MSYLYVMYLLTCTASALLTDVVPSGVTEEDTTEGDTSQDVHTSYPHTIRSGMCGSATYVITVSLIDLFVVCFVCILLES